MQITVRSTYRLTRVNWWWSKEIRRNTGQMTYYTKMTRWNTLHSVKLQIQIVTRWHWLLMSTGRKDSPKFHRTACLRTAWALVFGVFQAKLSWSTALRQQSWQWYFRKQTWKTWFWSSNQHIKVDIIPCSGHSWRRLCTKFVQPGEDMIERYWHIHVQGYGNPFVVCHQTLLVSFD